MYSIYQGIHQMTKYHTCMQKARGLYLYLFLNFIKYFHFHKCVLLKFSSSFFRIGFFFYLKSAFPFILLAMNTLCIEFNFKCHSILPIDNTAQYMKTQHSTGGNIIDPTFLHFFIIYLL